MLVPVVALDELTDGSAHVGPSGGRMSTSTTGLYPWIGYQVNDAVSVWGVTGYGTGAWSLTPDGAGAVDLLDGEPGRDAVAAAWHAASVVRFGCSTYGGAVTGVRVNEESFIVATATVLGDDVTEVTIAVGPDGTCACKLSTADGEHASAAPDVRAFEAVLAGRMAAVGVRRQGGAG